jgi:hypothetical protein
MENDQQHQVEKIPDFDVLSENPAKCAAIVRDKLVDAGFKKIKIVQHTGIGEVIPAHVEVSVNGDIIALIYQPIACHSYNKIDISGKTVLVATIDTMLSFYLAFLYANKDYFDKDRMLCMASYLFEVEEKNNIEQKGLLKRFSLDCYGKQPTMEELRAEKARKYTELKSAATPAERKEFERWFFKYDPRKTPGLRNPQNKPHVLSRNAHKTPTKTRVLEPETSVKVQQYMRMHKNRQTRRKRHDGPFKKKPHKQEDGPYAKRTFSFGKKKYYK